MNDLDLYGCANAGALCSPDEISQLRERIDSLFCTLPATCGIHLHANLFIGNPQFADAWQSCLDLLARSPAMDLLREALGPDLCYLSAQSLFRLVVDGATVPWHQDCDFAGTATRIINCWIPLCDCGTTAPGLEVARRRFTENLRKTAAPSGGPMYSRHYLGDSLESIIGERPEVLGPHLAAGGVLLFDQFCLHRTQPLSGRRVAVEIRCASLPGVLGSGARDVDGGSFEPVVFT